MLADFVKKSKFLQNLADRESEVWLILTVFITLALITGLWQGLANQTNHQPLQIVNVPDRAEINAQTPMPNNQAQVANIQSAGAGTYVASKNGTKYYLPTCAGAKRIKEENKIYFNSVTEAQARGLTPAANCRGL